MMTTPDVRDAIRGRLTDLAGIAARLAELTASPGASAMHLCRAAVVADEAAAKLGQLLDAIKGTVPEADKC